MYIAGDMEFQADIFVTYFFFLCLKLLHCASFTLALLGFIYNNLAEKEIGTKIGKVSVGKFNSLPSVWYSQKQTVAEFMLEMT